MVATYWLMMKNKIATILLLLLLCCCHYSPYYNYFYSNLTQQYSYASAIFIIVRNRNNNNNNNNNSYRQHHFLNNNNHYHLSIRQQQQQFKATSNHENEIENNNNYLENDLISIQINTGGDDDDDDDNSSSNKPKLYVVTSPDGTVSPLCTHEDDNLTDLYLDPRCVDEEIISIVDIKNNINDDVTIIKYYGEGWFAQRVVPSLGGGPGYGAEANSVWSIEENILDELIDDNVNIPILDMGIAHGEKARGGAI